MTMKPGFTCFVFAFSMLLSAGASAQNGFKIRVKINNWDKKDLYLGYTNGEFPSVKTTASPDSAGWFVFESPKNLEPGVFYLIFPSENRSVEFLAEPGKDQFSLELDGKNPYSGYHIGGSPVNEQFFQYKSLLAAHDAKAIAGFRDKLLKSDSTSLLAYYVKASISPDEGGQTDRFYLRKHAFEQFDVLDVRALNSPFLFRRIMDYVYNWTSPEPDSVMTSIDQVLARLRPNYYAFKLYLDYFWHKYEDDTTLPNEPFIVHLVEQYYDKNMADWLDGEELAKIVKKGHYLKPILIGKKGPNITMYQQDNSKISLYDIKADYTIILMWGPNCTHCKKIMPTVVNWYQKVKNKNVKVFAMCNETGDKTSQCWDGVREKNMTDFINVTDTNLESHFRQVYYVKTTPRVFILDANKTIINKGIGETGTLKALDQLSQLLGVQ